MSMTNEAGFTPVYILQKINELEQSKREYDSNRETLLRTLGWKHTCETPGSLWLWEKKLPDGRVALVTTSVALNFERTWAEQDYDGEDGYEIIED